MVARQHYDGDLLTHGWIRRHPFASCVPFDRVITFSTVDYVVSCATTDEIVSAESDDHVGTGRTHDDITLRRTEDISGIGNRWRLPETGCGRTNLVRSKQGQAARYQAARNDEAELLNHG